MKTNHVLFACCLLAIVLMLPGCSGCWKQPEPAIVNPTKYLEIANEEQEELWELISIKGETIGYRRTTIAKLAKEGETVYRVEQEDVIKANRLGQQMIGSIRTSVQQKPDGTFVQGEKIEHLSDQPMVTTFVPGEEQGIMERSASKIVINPETGEEDSNADPEGRNIAWKNIAWKQETLGPFAKLFSLWGKPIKPGETRTIDYFDLTLEQMVTIELTAGKVEPLLYNNRETNLIPVVEVTKIGDHSITSYLWVDANGNIVKTTLNEPSPMEIVLSTEEKVKNAFENAGKVNLNLYALVRVQGTISQPRSTQKVVFRLHRVNVNDANIAGDFAKRIPETAFQSVKPLDENTLDVMVTASSPEAMQAIHGSVVSSAAKETTVVEDLKYNEWLQSHSEKIAAMAAKASDRDYPPWEVAVDLERFVSQEMQRLSYISSFASASEVAETLKGDSAAYTVLLAAVARAKKIPSRVVAGLVYTTTNTSEGVMVFHFWTEMYIDGHWHSFDATTGNGGADASRIVLARSNLAEESLPMLVGKTLPLVGHLQVSIVTSE